MMVKNIAKIEINDNKFIKRKRYAKYRQEKIKNQLLNIFNKFDDLTNKIK